MRRLILVAACSTAFVALATATAAAAPTRDALIRPGQGIGKVNLGMTLTQVRSALGRPDAVARRLEYAFGGEYVELQWGGAWSVGFRTQAGKLRAVRVGTTKTNQRTRTRIGVGSRPREIVAAYPGATCVIRTYGKPFPGLWIVVTHASGRMTAFKVGGNNFGFPAKPKHEVLEVLVQEQWFSRPAEMDCGPDWRRL